ncbi:MAG: cytochrome P450 [Parvibaculaceae bacterium]
MTQAFEAAVVSDLDDSFDELINEFPDHLIGAPDDPYLDPAFSRDPFSILSALRDSAGGVVRRGDDGTYSGVEIFNVWGHDLSYPHFVALSHEAVKAIGLDRQVFENDQAYGVHQAVQGRTVNTKDGQEHFAMRRLLDTSFFGRGKMAEFQTAMTDPLVDYLVERLANKIKKDGAGEICRDIALPVTYKSISTIIGVPQSKFSYFVELGEIAQGGPRDPEAAMKAIAELDEYFKEEIKQRELDPSFDMLSVLPSAEYKGYQMSAEEIVQHCRFLLPGGIETTWRQTANTVMSLLLHPEQYSAVVADAELVDQAVEEALRWMPSGFVVPRRAAKDCVVAGTEIPEGSFINSIQGVANRDPVVWSNPDEFNIFREPHEHLTFHTGVHFCMGQNLARNTIRAVVRQLAEKIPTLKLACKSDAIETRGFGVRCPNAVPVTA